MAFIAQIAGDVKEGKSRELQAWLEANEKDFANAHPEGARYIGTYFAIYAAKGTGTVHTFIEMDSYGTQDALAAAGKDPDSVYGKLLNEVVDFFDQQSNNYTQALYKSVTSATLYGED
jgi:hypothetical protein